MVNPNLHPAQDDKVLCEITNITVEDVYINHCCFRDTDK